MSKKKTSTAMYIVGDLILFLFWMIFITASYYGIKLTSNYIGGIPLIIASVLICYLTLCIMALLMPRPKAGLHRLGTKHVYVWYLTLQFERLWGHPLIRFSIFSNTLMRTTFLNCCGAKVSYCHSFSPYAIIHDPSFVTIKKGASVGMNANIVAHTIIGGKLVLGPVYIGEGSMFGAYSVMMCRASIGDGAIVEGHCFIYPGAKVPKDSRIGRLSHIGPRSRLKEGEKVPGYSILGQS